MTKPEDDLPRPLRSRAFKRFDEGCATAVIVVFFLLPATAVAVPFLILKRCSALSTPIEGGRFEMTTLGTWVWGILTVLPSAVFIWWRRRRFRALYPPEAEPAAAPPRRVVAPAHPTGAVGVVLRVWGALLLLMGLVALGVGIRAGATRAPRRLTTGGSPRPFHRLATTSGGAARPSRRRRPPERPHRPCPSAGHPPPPRLPALPCNDVSHSTRGRCIVR